MWRTPNFKVGGVEEQVLPITYIFNFQYTRIGGGIKLLHLL